MSKWCKFSCMTFGYSAGDSDMLVVHANKYDKEEAVEIYNSIYGSTELKTEEDVTTGYAK